VVSRSRIEDTRRKTIRNWGTAESSVYRGWWQKVSGLVHIRRAGGREF